VDELREVALLSCVTLWFSADDVLVLKLLSALYTVVIECDATLSDAVVKVVEPELKVPLPSVVAPSLNVTVPLGVPAPGNVALTVAVKVTDCPNTDGLDEEATAVLLLALLTVCVTVPEVLVMKFPSPPYTAVIECAATLKAVVLKVA
jgi:hypothetical protein